jgi:ribulose-phosphate 3-epimerase
MKISASVYADLRKDLAATVSDLEAHGADMLHIDCKDDPSVFDDIRSLRGLTDLPIDLHLIAARPSDFEDLLRENPVDFLTLQFEVLEKDAVLPTAGFTHLGMAFSEGTDVGAFMPFAQQCDFALIMATVPGESGGVFREGSFRRIRDFKRLFPDRRVHVDGGVNPEVSFILRNLGVYCAVSGSYLFGEATVGSAILRLKNGITESQFRVRDFMRSLEETPHLPSDRLTTERILLSMEKIRLGFTLITDESGLLTGMVSNADLRRGMLKQIEDLNTLHPEHLINRNPIAVLEMLTVRELLGFIRRQPIPINYLPVVDANGKLVGSLTFNDLIKGEA